MRLPLRRSYLQSNLVLLRHRVLLLPFIVLLQNKHNTLAENHGKNVISAQGGLLNKYGTFR